MLSEKSLDRLQSVNPILAAIVIEAEKTFPLLVVCGHRGEAEQNKAYKDGFSKVKWPFSKHNSLPSSAVDLAPLPLNWSDTDNFKRMGEHIKSVALQHGALISWGGDWPRFKDYPHFEVY